jgi:TATA-box binding protein (TBP) (component of TFIID and TFIIIB)
VRVSPGPEETSPNGESVRPSKYVTVNIFTKGSINITGATDYERTPYIARDIVYQYIEDHLGITLDEYSSLHVSNIIGKWHLGACIINRKVIPTMAGYGLTAITTKRGVKVIVPLPETDRTAKVTFHRTGKILCCAFQNFDEMCYTYDVINHIVSECYETLVTRYEGSLSLSLKDHIRDPSVE